MATTEKRSGSYSVRVSLTDPLTGARIQKRVTARTKRELDAQVSELKAKWNRGDYIETSKTSLAAYLDQWLDAIKPTIRPASHDRYTRIVRNQIVPALGSTVIGRVSPLQVQEFYAGLLAAGLSSSTVALYHGVLHKALDQAVKWNLIPRNVCDAVDAPRPQNPEMQTWSTIQAKAFLIASADHELTALWQLALYTGMRRGEILALRWADIDLDRRQLAVRRTLTRGADGLVFGEPKTKAGRRSIALPAPVVTALRSYRASQNERRLHLGAAWLDHDLVFERGDGTVLHPNIVSRGFRRLVERLNATLPKDQRLPVIRFHDLRHTAATLMLANGEHPRIVQERLGHADISMTLGRYSHVTNDMQREAADRLAQLLSS